MSLIEDLTIAFEGEVFESYCKNCPRRTVCFPRPGMTFSMEEIEKCPHKKPRAYFSAKSRLWDEEDK